METIISPSLLACDFLNIEKEIKSFDNEKNIWFHLDIMDGHFVPNLTFGHPIVEKISKITKIPLDAHFMVNNPSFHKETFKNYNIHNFTFHFESVSDPLKFLTEAKNIYPSVGISLKPKTPIESLSNELLEKVDLILIMSVEPGFGGQKFIEGTYQKIINLNAKKNKMNLNFSIQVDGGVTDGNAKQLQECGANNLVAGSYIFKNPSSEYSNKINSLRE